MRLNTALDDPTRLGIENHDSLDDKALMRSAENIVDSTSSHVSTDSTAVVGSKVNSLRKFLLPSAPLARQARAELDKICEDLAGTLSSLSIGEKVQVLCAFGQLREYSVLNRVADRYNSRPLSYENPEFYSQLSASIDWSTLYATELSRFKSLSPTLHILRSLNRISIPLAKKQAAFSQFFDGMLDSASGMLPGTPKQLVELVMIASKNRFIHPALFEAIALDLESNHSSYSEDLIGDLARSFTTLEYYSEPLHRILRQQLPLVSHELSWWNLVDVSDYFNQKIPQPFSDGDSEVVARLANECWKWIPDMRCGYAAKCLRVLSELNAGDKRTIRSLIRHVPKSLEKLHKNITAETVVAAVRVGYNPRMRYGKRYGSVLYRRLAARLIGGGHNPLSTVSADLIVEVVEALRRIDRPQNELFDYIIEDIKLSPKKYSENHLIALDRLDIARGRGKAWKDRPLSSEISLSNLAHLAITDDQAFQQLMAKDDAELSQLKVGELEGLLGKPGMVEFVESNWLDMNLGNVTDTELGGLVKGLAINGCILPPVPLQLLVNRGSEIQWDNLDELVTFIASAVVLNGLRVELIPQDLFSLVTKKSTLSLETLKLCQLIGAHARLSEMEITDPLSKFLQWIESHLVSKYPQPVDRMHVGEFYVPNGAVTDLSVFPVNIPLAVPVPTIDLRKLHHSRSPVSVRRLMKDLTADAGIALMIRGETEVLESILAQSYLQKLGWSVKFINNRQNVGDPSVISRIVLGEDTQSGA
jgi:hypothetical protein